VEGEDEDDGAGDEGEAARVTTRPFIVIGYDADGEPFASIERFEADAAGGFDEHYPPPSRVSARSRRGARKTCQRWSPPRRTSCTAR